MPDNNEWNVQFVI